MSKPHYLIVDDTCSAFQRHYLDCITCQKFVLVERARNGGISTSEKKVSASRLNGLKGGRPRKSK